MIQAGNHPRTWPRILLILALLFGGGALLRFTVLRPALVPVTVHRVKAGQVEDTVVNSRAGAVQSRRRAGMSPGIAGLVTAIPVRKGSVVRQGETLLQLDDREYQAQVQLAQRSLEAASAAAEQARLEAAEARRNRERAVALAQHQVVSDTELDDAQTRALTTEAAGVAAEARIQQAEATLDVARATLAKTVIQAPFDGVVLDVSTEVGEWISPAPPGVPIPPVMTVIDLKALYVSAPIDEADVARIRVGLPVRITLDAFRGKSFAGKLDYVSSFVETREDQNRTLRVEAVFNDTALPVNLLPGLSADLELILDARENVVRIPTYALLEGGRVLKVQGDRLVEQKVTTGLRNWSYTEIVSGLAPGERVVVSLDRQEVVAGARVVVTGEVDR